MSCSECSNDLDYFTQENFNDDDVLFITETSVPNVCHCFLLSSLYRWVFDSEIPLDNPDYKRARKNPIDNTNFKREVLEELQNMYKHFYERKEEYKNKTYRKLKKLNFPSYFTEEDKKEFYVGVENLRKNEDIGLSEALETFINYKKQKREKKQEKVFPSHIREKEIQDFLEGVKALQNMGLNFSDAVKAYIEDAELLYDEDEVEKIKEIASYF